MGKKKKNVILLTIDEMRSDGLACYGNKNVYTPYADQLAEDGVLFTDAIATADLTPVCHASLLTGTYPEKNCIRTPFSYLRGKTWAEYYKELGYKTAGFVGVSFLGSKHGFERGYDHYEEAEEGKRGAERMTSWGKDNPFTLGNFWIDEFFDWLDHNHDEEFCVWGHYFFVHQGTEAFLLEEGMLDPKKDDDTLFYLNPKITLMDKVLLKPLIDRLKAWDLYDDCTIILMSDHGANCGEHPVGKSPNGDFYYPQHVCLYDEDIHIPLIIKSPSLPKGKRISGMVRQIDVLPTVLDAMGIDYTDNNFDGTSLLPVIEAGEAKGAVNYIEDLYEIRGPGALQGMRTDEFKYWRNLSGWYEEFYDLKADPGEKNNLIEEKLRTDPAFIKKCRSFVNDHLPPKVPIGEDLAGYKLTDDDQAIIEARLRSLGYIE